MANAHAGHEREPGDHPAHQQDRPAGRRARARERRDRGRPRHPRRRRGARLGQDRRGRPRSARGRSSTPSPRPRAIADAPARARSSSTPYFDAYRGVVALVRVVDGSIKKGDKRAHDGHGHRRRSWRRWARVTRRRRPMTELSVPARWATWSPGLKDVRQVKVGDTITVAARRRATSLCPATARPSPWCSPACSPSTARTSTSPAATRWRSSRSTTPALAWEPETSMALGFGFRVRLPGAAAHGGHQGAPRARVRPRPHLATAPSVDYHVYHRGRRDGHALH